VKTIGMVRVACVRADNAGLLATKITSGAIATSSLAPIRMRSVFSPVNRYRARHYSQPSSHRCSTVTRHRYKRCAYTLPRRRG
jgi:hypothetical protein